MNLISKQKFSKNSKIKICNFFKWSIEKCKCNLRASVIKGERKLDVINRSSNCDSGGQGRMKRGERKKK